MLDPRELVESRARSMAPDGDDERFAGYGVMGLPCSVGDLPEQARLGDF